MVSASTHALDHAPSSSRARNRRGNGSLPMASGGSSRPSSVSSARPADARRRSAAAARAAPAEPAEPAHPALAALALFDSKRLAVLGGFGAPAVAAGGGAAHWRSLWEAYKQYAEGGRPPKEEIERSRGCNYYCGDCHSLCLASTGDPRWERHDFGEEAAAVLQRTGHTLTRLPSAATALLFGGRNLQRGSCMNDAWLLHFSPHGAPRLQELAAAGTPPSPRAHHSATLLRERVYVLGGHTSEGRCLADVYVLRLASVRWEAIHAAGSPPPVLSRHTAVALGGTIVVFGGCARVHSGAAKPRLRFSERVYCLTEEAAAEAAEGEAEAEAIGVRWEAVECGGRQPAARAEHCAAAVGEKLYVLGGQRLVRSKAPPRPAGARACHELFVLDWPSRTWTQVARVPPLRREAASLVPLGNQFLIAFGGWSGAYSKEDPLLCPWSDALHVLHLPSMQWFQLDSAGCQPTPRYGHAAALIDLSATSAARCTVECGWRGELIAGEVATLRLCTFDASGNARLTGGDDFQLTMLALGCGEKAELTAQLTDNGDGTYAASFRPTLAAEYSLRVQLRQFSRTLTSRLSSDASPPPVQMSEVPIPPTARTIQVRAARGAALSARLASPFVVSGRTTAALAFLPVDQFGNHARDAAASPSLRVARTACLPPHAANGTPPPPPSLEWQASGDEFHLTLRGDGALVYLTAHDEATGLSSGEVELRLTGAPRSLHAAAASDGAVSGELYGPIYVRALDATGHVVGGAAFTPAVRVERPLRSGGESGAARGVEWEVAETQWRGGGAEEAAALLWVRMRGEPGDLELIVEDEGRGEGGEALAGARLALYLTGPPFFLQASGGQQISAAAGEEAAALNLQLVDSNGKHVTGLGFLPDLTLTYLPATDLPCAPSAFPAVGGQGDAEEAASCEVVRHEWSYNSRKVRQGVSIGFKVHGKAGVYTLLVNDKAGLVRKALSIPIRVEAGATVAERCSLLDASGLAPPLLAGERRSVTLQCVDAYGNAAHAGRDSVSLTLRPGPGGPPPLHADVAPLDGGRYRLEWCATAACRYVPWFHCNGTRLPLHAPFVDVLAAPPISLALRPVLACPGLGWGERSWDSTPAEVQVELGRQLLVHVVAVDAYGNEAEDGGRQAGGGVVHGLNAAVERRADQPGGPPAEAEVVALACRKYSGASGSGMAMRLAIGGRSGAATLRVSDKRGLCGELLLALLPGLPAAAQCSAEGAALRHTTAGARATVRLLLRDAWGNATAPTAHTQPPRLAVESAAAGGTPPSVAHRSVRLQPDGSYELQYELHRAGSYSLSVLLGGGHVHASPFPLAVAAAAAHALRLRAPPHAAACGAPFGPLAVWAVDAYGNAVAAGGFGMPRVEARAADAAAAARGARGNERPAVEVIGGEWGEGGEGEDGVRTALLTLVLCGRAGAVALVASDPSGALRDGSLQLALAAGAPHALHASCFSSTLAVGAPIGPISLTMCDKFANALPTGDTPICLRAVRVEGGGGRGGAAEGWGEAAWDDEAASEAADLVPLEEVGLEVVFRDVKASAAGVRGTAVFFLKVVGAEPGLLRFDFSLEKGSQPPGAPASPLPSCAYAPWLRAVEPASLVLPLSAGLSFYSENPIVTRALLARKWAQALEPSPSRDSDRLSFVWTVKTSDIDFKRLPRGTLCNHFESADLTTKVGLLACIKESALWHADANPDAFFPRCYDLSDESQIKAFADDFHLTSAAAVLQRFVTFGPRGADAPAGCASLRLAEAALHAVRAAVVTLLDEYLDQRAPPHAASPSQLAEMAALAASRLPAAAADGEARAQAAGAQAAALHRAAASTLRELARIRPQLEMEGMRNVWLLKPSYGSKGIGLRLVNDSLQKILGERDCLRVVQKYVERPLLLHGYKFDIRCWLLVTSWQPLVLWMYDECILRLCSEPFTLDDLSNTLRHITNRSIHQKALSSGAINAKASAGAAAVGVCRARLSSAGARKGGGGEKPDAPADATHCRPRAASARAPAARAAEALEATAAAERASPQLAGALWTGGQLDEFLRARGQGRAWERAVLPAMRRLAAATMVSAIERVEARKESFELYGIDMILDESLQPWLIEVNESPNLSSHNSAIKEQIVTRMLTEVVDLVVDHLPRAAEQPVECVGGWRSIHRGDAVAEVAFTPDVEGLNCTGTRLALHSGEHFLSNQRMHRAATCIGRVGRGMVVRCWWRLLRGAAMQLQRNIRLKPPHRSSASPICTAGAASPSVSIGSAGTPSSLVARANSPLQSAVATAELSMSSSASLGIEVVTTSLLETGTRRQNEETRASTPQLLSRNMTTATSHRQGFVAQMRDSVISDLFTIGGYAGIARNAGKAKCCDA
ncbi:hypothetical protein AB1Y20_002635 [Prymnesium parvum]|uniref:Uncharacterized protein n=1 Tax=Prymnesium parvum TaxID=97485 RepID=A0AB34J939_PRYPA